MNAWKRSSMVAALPIVLHGGSALGQEKDWSVTAGLKLWYNSWQSNLPDMNPLVGDDHVIAITSQSRFAPIGSLEFRRKQFFVSLARFKRTTYSFPDISDGGGRFSTRIERSETDFNLGWQIVPQLALTAGYKEVNLVYPIATLGISAGDSTTYGGFTAGLVASAPLGSGFSLYGNGSGGPTQARYSGGRGSNNGWYISSEMGIGYALGHNVATTLGYRYQVLSLNLGTQVSRDVTTGLILGLNYTF